MRSRHRGAARWALLLGLRGCCLLVAGLAAAGSALADDLRIAVSRGPVSLLIYVAEAQGYFGREGVAVQLQECTSGRNCFQLMSQGKADLATAAELLVSLESFTGSDAAIIATLNSSSHSIQLVGRRSAGIKAEPDMRGKKVATVAGTSAQYFLDRWLVFHGIDPKDVKVLPLAADQLTGALLRHEADAVAIWEPIASATVAALAQDAWVLPSPRVYVQHFSLIASRQAISRREADLIKLLRALARAARFVAERPAQSLQILNTRLGSEHGLSVLSENDFRLVLEQPLIATMEGQARWAAQQGLAQHRGSPPSLMRSIEPSLLRKAVPGAVSLVQ